MWYGNHGNSTEFTEYLSMSINFIESSIFCNSRIQTRMKYHLFMLEQSECQPEILLFAHKEKIKIGLRKIFFSVVYAVVGSLYQL